jgi:hypothetical protein
VDQIFLRKADLDALSKKLASKIPAPSVESSLTRVVIDRTTALRVFRARSDPQGVKAFLNEALSNPPKWLQPALVERGRPGRSSRWDARVLAHALLERDKLTLRDLDSAIASEWPHLLDSWREETADRR